MMKRKTIQYSFITVIVMIAAVIFLAFREYNRKHEDVADIKPAYSFTSSEIIQSFVLKEAESGPRYLDKIIAVTGGIKSVEKDDQGFYTIVLGESNSNSSVRCSMDSSHNAEATGLNEHMVVTLKGVCTGFNSDELLGSDVILNRCTVKK